MKNPSRFRQEGFLLGDQKILVGQGRLFFKGWIFRIRIKNGRF
jgi:hypothetical protein